MYFICPLQGLEDIHCLSQVRLPDPMFGYIAYLFWAYLFCLPRTSVSRCKTLLWLLFPVAREPCAGKLTAFLPHAGSIPDSAQRIAAIQWAAPVSPPALQGWGRSAEHDDQRRCITPPCSPAVPCVCGADLLPKPFHEAVLPIVCAKLLCWQHKCPST